MCAELTFCLPATPLSSCPVASLLLLAQTLPAGTSRPGRDFGFRRGEEGFEGQLSPAEPFACLAWSGGFLIVLAHSFNVKIYVAFKTCLNCNEESNVKTLCPLFHFLKCPSFALRAFLSKKLLLRVANTSCFQGRARSPVVKIYGTTCPQERFPLHASLV